MKRTWILAAFTVTWLDAKAVLVEDQAVLEKTIASEKFDTIEAAQAKAEELKADGIYSDIRESAD